MQSRRKTYRSVYVSWIYRLSLTWKEPRLDSESVESPCMLLLLSRFSPLAPSLPTFCVFLLPLQLQWAIKWEVLGHKRAQQDHPAIHMWIPLFTQTLAWWQHTIANIMSPDFHDNPGLRSRYSQWTDEKTGSARRIHLPEVTEWVRGRDVDLNPGMGD